jgi:serine/threonine protein kinase/Flp pilus assembly protein TadD
MSGNWTQVKEILDAAIRRRPEERPAFLDEACNGDAHVRDEVESLLSSFGRADGFMEKGVVESATVRLDAFSTGKVLGRYEIVSLLGRGGMGEVYLARDRQLRRNVAIKVLPDTIASDAARLNRFEQEAIAASALNHPNIMTIHEIGEESGTRYIVSEYVAGATLRERIPTIAVPDALEAAIQVASALKAAHDSGIVHRDIKPENIMIREDGLVKVLDFGLAKLSEQTGLLDTEAATLAQIETQPGTVMGTVTYMSPEQARGLHVDGRTDLWSLGAVLYELLTGEPPFRGETAMDTLAAILEKEPSPLPKKRVLDGTDAILKRALTKDPAGRYQTANEMLNDLRAAVRGRELVSADDATLDERKTDVIDALPTSGLRPGRTSFALKFAIIGALIAAIGVVVYLSTRPAAIKGNSSAPGRSPAYDLYLRGNLKALKDNRADVEEAIKLLERAVQIDPNYAEAYAALAKAYTTKAFQFAPDSEKKRISEDAEIAVAKALELDPNSADGHFARGIVLWTHAKRFPHELSIRSYKRAIEINPNLDEVHHRLAMVYSHIGLLDDAQAEMKKQLEINPDNTMARFRVGVIDAYQGKYEEAIEVYKTVPDEVSPALISRNKADALVHLGRLDEANAIVEDYLKSYPNDEGGNVTSVKAVIFAKQGNWKEAQIEIKRAIEIGQGFGHFHHTAYNIASAYAIMNMPDDAMKWLQNAADDGFPCYPYFAVDPQLDKLRSDPRFIEFMEKGKTQVENFRRLV